MIYLGLFEAVVVRGLGNKYIGLLAGLAFGRYIALLLFKHLLFSQVLFSLSRPAPVLDLQLVLHPPLPVAAADTQGHHGGGEDRTRDCKDDVPALDSFHLLVVIRGVEIVRIVCKCLSLLLIGILCLILCKCSLLIRCIIIFVSTEANNPALVRCAFIVKTAFHIGTAIEGWHTKRAQVCAR